MRVAVLGGGVAGVVAAGELALQPGVTVELFEKAPHLGGLQHSVVVRGAAYDIGAFLFGEDHELLHVFPTLRGAFMNAQPTHRSLTPSGTLDDYPSTVRGYVRDHGVLAFARALASLLVAKVRYRKRDTLPSLVRYYLGDTLYERSGFRTYIERLYGLPDHEIDMEFAARRLFFLRDVCSLRARAARATKRLLRRADLSYVQPRVLVRPREGFQALYALVHEALTARGVAVALGTAPEAIRRGATGTFELALPDGVRVFDRIVSTLPVAVTARLIGQPLGEALDYMKLISLFYRYVPPTTYDAAVVCNLTRSGRWKRLVDFSAIYGPHEGSGYFVVEVTTRASDAESIAEAEGDFRAHTAAHGFFPRGLEFVGAHVTEHAYPVYRVSDAGRVIAARERLTAWGIDLLGRQGRFDYSTSAMVATQARVLAEGIAEDSRAP